MPLQRTCREIILENKRTIKIISQQTVTRLRRFPCVSYEEIGDGVYMFTGSNKGIRLEPYKKKLLKIRTPRPILRLGGEIYVEPCISGKGHFKILTNGTEIQGPYINSAGHILFDKAFLLYIGASGSMYLSYSLTSIASIKNGIIRMFITNKIGPMSYHIARRSLRVYGTSEVCYNTSAMCESFGLKMNDFEFSEIKYDNAMPYGVLIFRRRCG